MSPAQGHWIWAHLWILVVYRLRTKELESDGILMRDNGEDCPDAELKTAMVPPRRGNHLVVHT